MERRLQPGLWIPNTEQRRWDPSHPEKHTELLTAEPKALRLARAHAIRLAQAENKRSGEPVLCSFNVEALGWMFIKSGMGQAAALQALWEQGAADLAKRLTQTRRGYRRTSRSKTSTSRHVISGSLTLAFPIRT